MSWPEVCRHLDSGRRTIVCAFGATEQHGPHLPLATDTLLGDELARRVAEELDALVAPTVALGCSAHHGAFPGTLSVSDETFAAVVGDLVDSFARGGFARAVLLPSHGGNFAPLGRAIEAVREPPGLRIDAVSDLGALVGLAIFGEQEEGIPAGEGGLHAGEWETSLLMAANPDLVWMQHAQAGFVGEPERAVTAVFSEGVHSVSANGVIGDPRRASAERGERYWRYITESVLATIAEK